MRFELLGAVRALDGARTFRIDRPRQRAVLGYLLLSPNRAVPMSELVEAVWGGAEPSTARNQIQADISAIRRRLYVPDGTGIPSGGPAGYVLPLRSGQLDLDIFTDRVRRARSIAVDERQGLLREALSLWRGDPLADARAAFVEAARARLTEQRLAAQEALADIELAAGRHEDLAAELAALAIAHPTRERLVAQLMLALYRCGRIDEAVRAGHRFRERLVQDYGLRPGGAHDELEQAILRRDASLDLSAPIAAARPVPAQLPAGVAGFTGRAAELDKLRELLARAGDSPMIVAVDGTAGVGKTALALRWAREVAHRYPDGQLFLNLRGHSAEAPLRPAGALAQLLRSLGLPVAQIPQDVAEAAALYRSLIAGGRYLVVLDDAATADEVRPLLPGGPGCLAIITSRRRLGGLAVRDGAQTITLGVLTPQESTGLLSRLLGDDRVGAEPDATEELTALCAYLPLALCIAAARIREQPTIAGYLAELRADRLAALAIPDDDATAMRSTLELSYRAMDPETARLFRLIGLVPGPDFQPEAVAAMAGLPVATARQLVQRLFTGHVVEHMGDNRFTLHDLLREYVGELAKSERTGVAATRRLYGWYVETARAAADQVYPHMLRLPVESPPTAVFPDAKAATAWLDAEYPNLVEAVRRGVERGQHSATWQLADALRGYLLRRSHLPEWLMIADTAMTAARVAGDERAQVAVHLSLSLAYRSRCDYPRTIEHLQRARELVASSDWVAGELTTLGNLAGAYYDIGSLADAHDLFVRVLEISRREDYPGNTAATLSNLGATLRDLGRPAEALVRLGEAVEEFRAMASPSGEADALDNIGTTHHQMGEWAEALTSLEAALAIQHDLGDNRSEASVLTNRAAVLSDAGRAGEAVDSARRAMDLATRSGSPRTEAEAFNAAALAYLAQDQPRHALRLAERSHRLATEIGVRQPQIVALIAQAAAHHRIGATEAGSAFARQALHLATSHGFAFLADRAGRLLG